MAQTRGDVRVLSQAHVCTRCRRVSVATVLPRRLHFRGHELTVPLPPGRRRATPVVASSRLESAPGGAATPRRRQPVGGVGLTDAHVTDALRACEALCVSAALALLVRGNGSPRGECVAHTAELSLALLVALSPTLRLSPSHTRAPRRSVSLTGHTGVLAHHHSLAKRRHARRKQTQQQSACEAAGHVRRRRERCAASALAGAA